jgi:hypothetical protein
VLHGNVPIAEDGSPVSIQVFFVSVIQDLDDVIEADARALIGDPNKRLKRFVRIERESDPLVGHPMDSSLPPRLVG